MMGMTLSECIVELVGRLEIKNVKPDRIKVS